MKLSGVRVNLYRNIVDSNLFPIEESVTCLVGKNESGKTAILQALYSLNPAHPELVQVDITKDYPRWRKVRDERKTDLGSVVLVTAFFALEDGEIQRVFQMTSLHLPQDTLLKVQRDYAGETYYSLETDEARFIGEIIKSLDNVSEDLREKVGQFDSLDELIEFLDQTYQNQSDKRTSEAKSLISLKEIFQSAKLLLEVLPLEVEKFLQSQLPQFFYFSEYSSLPGRLDLTRLLSNPSVLSPSDRTALALLKLAGVQGKEFMSEDFEERIAELEAAANEITAQVFEYWTQNKDLTVNLVGDSEIIRGPSGQSVVHRYVDIRLNDLRHQMTTNFETRSSGFRWFFSFITAFSEFSEDGNVIILLDEPGLGLHARAQRDLLRFIDEQLGKNNQVIYTTHSPFLVNPRQLERVRLVEDLTTRQNPDTGAKVSVDVLSVHGDTLFPLQAALGYDLAQHLLIGGNNLLVEGPSDMIYLITMSEYLERKGRTGLSEKFTLVPAGGIDKVPTFIALLGAKLDVTVLIDAANAPSQRIRDLIEKGLLEPNKFISIDRVTGKFPSDIEDMFSEDEYLELYNIAFGSRVVVSDLQGNDSIIKRLERYRGEKFDHLKPATVFLRNKETFLERLSEETLGKFEALFTMINATIE